MHYDSMRPIDLANPGCYQCCCSAAETSPDTTGYGRAAAAAARSLDRPMPAARHRGSDHQIILPGRPSSAAHVASTITNSVASRRRLNCFKAHSSAQLLRMLRQRRINAPVRTRPQTTVADWSTGSAGQTHPRVRHRNSTHLATSRTMILLRCRFGN